MKVSSYTSGRSPVEYTRREFSFLFAKALVESALGGPVTLIVIDLLDAASRSRGAKPFSRILATSNGAVIDKVMKRVRGPWIICK